MTYNPELIRYQNLSESLPNTEAVINNSLRKEKILVVDDTSANLKLVSTFLRESGFDVWLAKSGFQALKILDESLPELILLDIAMPEIDGFETCRRLKAWEKTKDIPVIFMTAVADFANPEHKIQGLALGAVDYISKPIQLDEILARVKTHLHLRSLTKQLQQQNAHLQQEIRERQQIEEELRKSEEHIKASLKEKEVLLQEIHHRVKNNLQIVTSLLQMQTRRVRVPEVALALQDSQNRIASIALVHEKLYRSEDLANVNFSHYIPDLTAYLFDSYNVTSNAINLTFELDDILLKIESAIPLSLIITELVSNSIKYAFPDKGQGEINVEFHANSDGTLTLIVRDNGIGIPQAFDWETTTTLGLTLIQNLVEQLEGTLECDRPRGTDGTFRTRGTEFRITFPEDAIVLNKNPLKTSS